MPLIDFWSVHTQPGMHPQDRTSIDPASCLHLATQESVCEVGPPLEDNRGPFRQMLHTGLHPQPFIGNVRDASAYILFGNPGFSLQDYQDEFGNPSYAALCASTLSGDYRGFAPLDELSKGTGANRYWEACLKQLIEEVGKELDVNLPRARQWVAANLAVIEAGAYHSLRFPRKGFRVQPSAVAAQDFVSNYVLPRAANGECAVFVWRSADFWAVGEAPGTLTRQKHLARFRHLSKGERDFLKAKLVERYRPEV